tara:strand:+ start:303 stop:575 length:273 start_codon:yes stop_codon:yes gene_type:complete
MEVLITIGIILSIIVGYFVIGIVLKIIWSWAPMIILLPIDIWFMFTGGYWVAILGIFLFFIIVFYTMYWQSTKIHNQIEKGIENLFYFGD